MPGGSAAVEQALEELYSTDPRAFTKKRDAIAKALNAQGDDEGASAVRARRKPMQLAWVLNQLARRYPEDVAELVDVGRELAREQRKALRGEVNSSFRESIERQRKVVGALTRRTADLMKELGVEPSGHLDAIASALYAALVDPAVGARLEEGRLEKPPEAAVGFAGPLPSGPLPKKVPARLPEKAQPERRAGAQPNRRVRQARALAQKRALAKERAERRAAEKKAVAALRAVEREAEKRHKAAVKAEKEARDAIARAKELTRAAEESAQHVAEAKRQLARVNGR